MRLSFDIGGTFTDIILFADDGRIITDKVLSLHDRVGKDVAAVAQSANAGRAESFIHATTIGSNAVIEGTVAQTGFITTRGFRDELDTRGQRRPNIYDVNWERPPPLVPRPLRLEVTERILGNGSISKPLDITEAEACVRMLVERGVKAIAVCLINSYLNPVHEKELGALIRRVAPGLVLCLSSDVDPQMKEYERASTTVVNASLVPVIDSYLTRIERDIASECDRLLIMQSNGGLMSAQTARERPAFTIESGPAAGVLAAARLAREGKLGDVLSFDMGGTTAKGCLIEGGLPLEKPGSEIGGGANTTSHRLSGAGHAVRVPSLDIVEAGAGGGSIAWLDEGGALRVGPRSAGADPGPVCYGRGGKEPTVTDANVVLGYMNPSSIADAKLRIDRDAAYEAINTKLAKPLGIDVMQVAYGITQVANSAMTRVLKAVSTERGRDPRGCAMVAFGGSGPVHAAALAESMDMKTIVVPIYPGLFSALGLLLADYRHDHISSMATRAKAADKANLQQRWRELEATAMARMQSDGIPTSAVRFERYADLKYGYQMEEMTLPFPDLEKSAQPVGELLTGVFTRAHQQAYGYVQDAEVELVSLRLRALASAGAANFSETAARVAKDHRVRAQASREAYFGPVHGKVTVAVCGRFDIPASGRAGPLIIEEPDTTIVVPPGWTVSRDALASLILSRA